MCVLALSNPYHLMQGEAEELYRRIGRWVHFVQIGRPAADRSLEGGFVGDLASDFPPRYIPRKIKVPLPTDPRTLDVGQVVASLAQQIDRLTQTLRTTRHANVLSERMQRDMYIRFKASLAGRQERAEERRPTVSNIVLVEGLSAAHFFVGDRQPFTPEEDEAKWRDRLNEASGPDGLKLAGENDYLVEPVNQRQAAFQTHRTSRFSGFDADMDDIWSKANVVKQTEAPRKRASRYRAHNWSRKNESPGGMALFCAKDSPMQVKVGELVAYGPSKIQPGKDWRIGTIRWLRTRPNGGLELGIKHLADDALAAGSKAVRGPGSGAEYFRAIFVPRVNPLVKEATLLTPAAVYDVGTVLKLNLRELVVYAQLTELLETTRMFAHFRYKLVQAPPEEHSASAPGAKSPLR